MAATPDQVTSTLNVLREHGLAVLAIGDRLTWAVPAAMDALRVDAWISRYQDSVLDILAGEDRRASESIGVSVDRLYYARYCVQQGVLSEYRL